MFSIVTYVPVWLINNTMIMKKYLLLLFVIGGFALSGNQAVSQNAGFFQKYENWLFIMKRK